MLTGLLLAVLPPVTTEPVAFDMQVRGQGTGAKGVDGKVEKLDGLDLTITFPTALGMPTTLSNDPKAKYVRAAWKCSHGRSQVSVTLHLTSSEDYGFEEPEDVREVSLRAVRLNYDPDFSFENTEILAGAFGWASYGALAWGPVHAAEGKQTGTCYVMAGLLEKEGYAFEVIAEPRLDVDGERLVQEMLRKGISYAGKTRNPLWTDEEAKARWLADAPPSVANKFGRPIRTKHYIVLTNCKDPDNFIKKLEQNYEIIRKTYPFPEVELRRLMPVFLFLTPDQYHEFYAKQFRTSVEEARKTGGVARGDFYSTYYSEPGDPTHIHECTHQVFHNRLRLSGGGSWFHEGVAEYVATKRNERNDAARAVKRNRHTKLAEFMQLESLLFSSRESAKGDSEAASHYEQAALLIEFVRESRPFKDRFLAWVHAVGSCPRNDIPAIERATKATLGVDLARLEAQWIDYCKKR